MSKSTGNVFYMSGYSASTTLASGLGIVLILPAKEGVHFTVNIWAGMVWDNVLGPCLLTG